MNTSLTGLNGIDITIIILVVLMAIKGLMNGFLREIFGFVGLIGGIFIASRSAVLIAHAIDKNIFHLENFAALKLIGFLAVLALVWGLSVFIGNPHPGTQFILLFPAADVCSLFPECFQNFIVNRFVDNYTVFRRTACSVVKFLA